MNAVIHSRSSVKRWGGEIEDYLPLHKWMDGSKEMMGDIRHRALRHHAQGIFEGERVFGPTITISTGKVVPTRDILERHVTEDMGGWIPTLSDWLREMPMQVWMSGQKRVKIKTIKLNQEDK